MLRAEGERRSQDECVKKHHDQKRPNRRPIIVAEQNFFGLKDIYYTEEKASKNKLYVSYNFLINNVRKQEFQH